MLPRKPPRHYITQSIQALIRSFPSQTITIVRETASFTFGFRGTPTTLTVYKGEALFIESGQRVELQELGLVQTSNPRLMVPGNRPIQVGDRVTLGDVLYEITDPTNRWNAFTLCNLRQVKAGV